MLVYNKYFNFFCLVGETVQGAIHTKLNYQGCNLDDEDDWHQLKNGSALFAVSSFAFSNLLHYNFLA